MSAAKKYSAGVKDYRETYWMPEYTPSSTWPLSSRVSVSASSGVASRSG